MSGPLLQLDALTKRYAGKEEPAVRGASLVVEPGQVLALLGPSGSGKTTLLRLVAGFEHPDSGSVLIDDRMVSGPAVHEPPEERGIGFVFQHGALFPHLTVRENLAFGVRALPRKERAARIASVARLCDLEHLAERYPHELSGGEQQRTALARALARGTDVVLLDEPMSNVDVRHRAEIGVELQGILREARTTAILVTHDHEDAFALADRIAVMRNGVIEQVGTPEEVYGAPASPFVAQFVGAANFLPATCTARGVETEIGTFGVLPPQRVNGDAVVAMLRPGELALEPDPLGAAEIIRANFAGVVRGYIVRLPSGLEVRCMMPACMGPPIDVGTRVRIMARSSRATCFSARACAEVNLAVRRS
jgi:iron(III) transport system ATP-binding protein